MAVITETTVKKLESMPAERLNIVLAIIDQFCEKSNSTPKKRTGVAKGKIQIPDDFDKYDEDIVKMFEEAM